VIRLVGIIRLAAIGATTAVLWLSPAAAADQAVPGAVQLDLLKLKVELQTKYAEMERLAGGSR
jgi:hypothetical protein